MRTGIGLIIIALGLAGAIEAATLQVLQGKVIAITDGDTVQLLVGKTPHKIRLSGIDCAERNAPYGGVARDALAHFVFQQRVIVLSQGKDRYGRHLGAIYMPDGTNINQLMVLLGMCHHYVEYAKDDEVLRLLQADAQAQRRGIWADPEHPPIPPWEWRAQEKARRAQERD